MFREAINSVHDPQLNAAPQPVNPSRPVIRKHIMKNNRASGATKFGHAQNNYSAQRKPAAGPSERRVLQQDPPPAPALRFAPEPSEAANPSTLCPRHTENFHWLALPFERPLQPSTIIFQRVCGRVSLAEQRDESCRMADGRARINSQSNTYWSDRRRKLNF